ncbi:hypothetical protein L2E82_10126 [Cichorium intybus]|uniref:Uncharacterized protein n=1 Tax=Cichorium intybus TaxID=13427 RepID=A0ACB9GAR4_CICIN|nr:hypothetical protein L2E82_10126 [Cichorium intybus]
MNPIDFIELLESMRNQPVHATESLFEFNMAKNHLMGFLNNYLLRFAKNNMELCSYYQQPLGTPPITVLNISKFKNGEILDEPYGVVFKGPRNETEVTVKFFEVDYIDLHPSSFISSIKHHVNPCPANSYEKKKRFIDHMSWWLVVRKTLKRAYKRNFRG